VDERPAHVTSHRQTDRHTHCLDTVAVVVVVVVVVVVFIDNVVASHDRSQRRRLAVVLLGSSFSDRDGDSGSGASTAIMHGTACLT